MITLTPAAAQEVKRLMEKEHKPNLGLRLGVKGGGCSGLSYVVALEEAVVEALLDDVEAEVAAVEPHAGVGGARGGDAGGGEGAGGDEFAGKGLVLHGVVEVEFLESAPGAAVGELADVEREGGAVVDAAEAAGGALELDGDFDVVVDADLAHRSGGVGAGLDTEPLHLGRGEVERNFADGVVGEEEVAGIGLRGRKGRGAGERHFGAAGGEKERGKPDPEGAWSTQAGEYNGVPRHTSHVPRPASHGGPTSGVPRHTAVASCHAPRGEIKTKREPGRRQE